MESKDTEIASLKTEIETLKKIIDYRPRTPNYFMSAWKRSSIRRTKQYGKLRRMFTRKEPDDAVLFFMRDSIRIGFDNVSYRKRISGKHKHE